MFVSQVEKAVGGKASLGRISWGISNGIWVEANEFSVIGASTFSGDLELSRIYAEVSITPLLGKKVVVD